VVGDDGEDHALGECPALVADGFEGFPRGFFDLGEVVVALAHEAAEFRVGAAGFLVRGGGFGGAPLEFLVEGDDVFEDVVGDALADFEVGQVEGLVEGVPLGFFEGDL